MRKRLSGIWIASVSLLAASVLLTACHKTDLQTKTETLERGLPDETSYNVKITQYIDNRFEYELEADRIERFTDRRILHGYGVNLSTYDKDNRISSVIKADTTMVDDARNLIIASGKVFMESTNGTLSTSNIAWDRAVDEITAPNQVILKRDGSIMYGKNLRTNSKLSLVIMDAVSAEGIVRKEDIDW